MLGNNLISILRGFRKNKTITLINLAGLSIGLTVAIVLLILIKYENSYDTFHKNGNRICRVITGMVDRFNKTEYIHISPAVLGENLQTEFPELSGRISLTKNFPRLKTGEVLYGSETLYADDKFLNMFSFNLVKGSVENALTEPYSIVLTQTLANKIYGNNDPLFQSVEIRGKNYKVTGIVEDVPSNSSIRFDALVSLSSYDKYNMGASDWKKLDYFAYINLPENITKNNLESRLQLFTKKHTDEVSFYLQPMLRIHLHSKTDYSLSSAGLGNITDLYLHSLFVFFILLIAVINYTNISFNQILKRSNEIGMRRILGATKFQIFTKSWIEALLFCIVSFIIALLLVKTAIPELNMIIKRNIEFSFVLGSSFDILILLLATSIFLGAVPAVKLIKSSNPHMLKRGTGFNTSNKFVKGMLVVQFAIALFFLITTILVSNQVNMINSTLKIGENEDLVIVNNTNYNPDDKDSAGKSKIFYNEISKNNLIKASYYEGNAMDDDFLVNNQKINCFVMKESDGYFSVNNYKIILGRIFDEKKYPADAVNAVVVNESFIKMYNIKDPLNTGISKENENYKIIGVVEDYYSSLKEAVIPQIIMLSPYAKEYIFKIDKQNSQAALELIKKEWARFFPDNYAKYQFGRDSMLNSYRDELMAQKIFKILSAVSVFLALLGVAGLSSLIMIKRKKEIAIRKIHGAAISALIMQFSKEYIIIIGVSFLTASVISYYYISKFLEDYTYKISINPLPFLVSLAMVLITVFTVIIIQSLKSLYANPIESIKSE